LFFGQSSVGAASGDLKDVLSLKTANSVLQKETTRQSRLRIDITVFWYVTPCIW